MTFRTGLFNRTCWVIPDEIKYNMNHYDDWLNSTNPYNNELDDELIDHLTEMRDLETEEDQEEYCEKHDLTFNDIKHYL